MLRPFCLACGKSEQSRAKLFLADATVAVFDQKTHPVNCRPLQTLCIPFAKNLFGLLGPATAVKHNYRYVSPWCLSFGLFVSCTFESLLVRDTQGSWVLEQGGESIRKRSPEVMMPGCFSWALASNKNTQASHPATRTYATHLMLSPSHPHPHSHTNSLSLPPTPPNVHNL